MPTFNQLIKNGRTKSEYKSKTPVLQHGFNSLTNKPTDLSSPQKRGVLNELVKGWHDFPPSCDICL